MALKKNVGNVWTTIGTANLPLGSLPFILKCLYVRHSSMAEILLSGVHLHTLTPLNAPLTAVFYATPARMGWHMNY